MDDNCIQNVFVYCLIRTRYLPLATSAERDTETEREVRYFVDSWMFMRCEAIRALTGQLFLIYFYKEPISVCGSLYVCTCSIAHISTTVFVFVSDHNKLGVSPAEEGLNTLLHVFYYPTW